MTFSDVQITILEAAEDVFLQKGYSGTSTRDIAQAAGYRSVAGLYNHFSDKETIFQALLEYRSPYDELLGFVTHLEANTAEEFLGQLFRFLTAYINDHQHFVQLALIDFLEFNARHIHGIVLALQTQIMAVLVRLETVEGLRKDLPPILLFRFMGMQVFGYALTSRVLPMEISGMMSETEWQAHFLDVFINGLGEKHE